MRLGILRTFHATDTNDKAATAISNSQTENSPHAGILYFESSPTGRSSLVQLSHRTHTDGKYKPINSLEAESTGTKL
jgi:hypothetical protein